MTFRVAPTHWQLRTRRLELPHGGSSLRRPLVMGIVNVTPDSFSDGGQYLAPEKTLAHAQQLVDTGADVFDIGPASSHPDAGAVTPAWKWPRA